MSDDYKGMTHHQLLLEVVPDFDVRMHDIKETNPALWEEIRHRAVDSYTGFRPLEYWKGCL